MTILGSKSRKSGFWSFEPLISVFWGLSEGHFWGLILNSLFSFYFRKKGIPYCQMMAVGYIPRYLLIFGKSCKICKKGLTPFGTPVRVPNGVSIVFLMILKVAMSTFYGRSPCSRRIFLYPPPATGGIWVCGGVEVCISLNLIVLKPQFLCFRVNFGVFGVQIPNFGFSTPAGTL